MSDKRYAIFGAGSLGTVLGAYLTKNGIKIDLITRNKDTIEGMRKNGAQIEGTVSFSQPVSALYPSEMSGKYDIIFLLIKQQHNKEAVSSILPFLADDGVICTMQNGLPERLISQLAGKKRTLGCTIGWGATMLGGGVSQLTSDPDHLVFALEKSDEVGEEKFNEIKDVLLHMGTVETEENFAGARWVKLLVNSAFSGLSTVFGCTFGEVASSFKYRKIAQACIIECIRVAHKEDVEFEPIQGVNVVKLLDYNNPFKRLFSLMIIPQLMKSHKDIKASMLQDIEKGKKSEVDSINGIISDTGKENGVPTPINDTIIKIIHDIEDGKRKPGKENLELFK